MFLYLCALSLALLTSLLALDANGVRFLLAVRAFQFERRSMGARASLTARLSFRDVCWAMQSHSQDILLDASLGSDTSSLTWQQFSAVGAPFWITNQETLKKYAEIIAKNLYTAKEDRDPFGCTLLYLALRKKKARKPRIYRFLPN